MDQKQSEEELMQRCVKEMLERCARGETCEIDLGLPTAFLVLACIQAGLKRGGFEGPSVNLLKLVATELERALSTTPACAEVCRLGWQRGFELDDAHTQN
jgi:hypothetical protein